MKTTARLFAILAILWLCPAVIFADEVEVLRQQLKTLEGKKLINAYGKLYYLSQETDDIDYQHRCLYDLLNEAQRQHDIDEEADTRAQRITFFYNTDQNDSVYHYAEEDLHWLAQHGKWVPYYETWNLLVSTYNFDGKLTTGLEEAQKMYDDAMQRKIDFGLGLSYYAMGDVYANMNNYEEAAEAYKQSEEILLRDSLVIKLNDIFTNYGDVLEKLQRFDELDQMTTKWSKFLNDYYKGKEKSKGDYAYQNCWAYYYIACAQAALGLNQLERADSALNEVKRRVFNDEEFVNRSWLYYRATLCLKQGFPEEALALNNQRMKQVDPTDGGSMLQVLRQRAEIMRQLRRYEEAADLYQQMYELNDSANTHATREQLTEMNTKYQVGELRMRQAEANTRWAIAIGSLIVLALGIFAAIRIRAARRLQRAHNALQTAHSQLEQAYDQLEETTIAKERIESDLRIARNIQMGMVPHTFPERDDVDLYASMTPAKEVGGDLYDYLIIGQHVYFCLGDVSGKGVPASLFMAMARNMFHVLAQQELPPAEIATKLNNTLAEDNENSMFVTMFIGVADIDTGHLEFCNAGHNPPVLIDNSQLTIDNSPTDSNKAAANNCQLSISNCQFLEMLPNAPIGLWPGLEYDGEQIDSISGKALFVYTDGLNEAENRQQEQFTDERLLEVLETTPYENCKQTVEHLRELVEAHRDGADPNDDLTMLCLKIIHKPT